MWRGSAKIEKILWGGMKRLREEITIDGRKRRIDNAEGWGEAQSSDIKIGTVEEARKLHSTKIRRREPR